MYTCIRTLLEIYRARGSFEIASIISFRVGSNKLTTYLISTCYRTRKILAFKLSVLTSHAGVLDDAYHEYVHSVF
jgi:hypothetical protein